MCDQVLLHLFSVLRYHSVPGGKGTEQVLNNFFDNYNLNLIKIYKTGHFMLKHTVKLQYLFLKAWTQK